MTPLIQVEHLSKTFRLPRSHHNTLRGRVLHPLQRTTYEEFAALNDVSFSVERGEFYGIVGRNGCGKSTLLKILAGIYRPDSGSVVVNDSLAPFIELGVGFNMDLSGRENLFINGSLLGLSRKQLHQRYDAIVEFAELEQFMDLKLRNFSSGMQVRLAFSIAIESGAEILLIDEVLAVGDERFQRKCFDVFRQRKADGKTVVFVSHDMAAVEQFCDRVLLLHHGQTVLEDEPRAATKMYHKLNVEDRRTHNAVDDTDTDTPAHVVRAVVENLADGETIPQGERIRVTVRVKFEQAIDCPTIGLIVRDPLGSYVAMMNTLWSGVDTGSFAAGDAADFQFQFDNPLHSGSYSITAEVARRDGGEIFESRHDVAEFTVRSEHSVGTVVDLPYEVSVTPVTEASHASS